MRVNLLPRSRSLIDWGGRSDHEPGGTAVLVCDCAEPDVQAIGSWWPTNFVACAACGRLVSP
jgi:hypothetical protein